MQGKIVKFLKENKNKNLRIEDIAMELRVSKDELKEELLLLEKEGIIYHGKNDKYTLLSNTSMKIGLVKMTKNKGIIVRLEDKTEYKLNNRDNTCVKHDDIILLDINVKSDTANLIKVLKRKDLVGEVIKEDDVYKVIYEEKDSDTSKEIILDEVYPLGSRVLIDGMTGSIKCIVGHKDEPNIKTKEVLVEHGFHVEFPDDYKIQLNLIPSYLTEEVINESKKNGRLDQRNIPFVTIDGDDTKDFDDAVCFYNDVLYVAIADVPDFIEEDSPIDKETIKRGISVYTPGNVEPMLDHKFSSGICSLIPGEDRFTTSLVAKLDEDNNVKSYRLCESIINSKMRMTYSEVNLILEKGIIPCGYENYVGMITKLYDVAMSMKKKMLRDGFLEFSSTEVHVYLEQERVNNIKRRYHGKAEELIEFLMLLKNLTKTSYFIKHGLPFIARNHDEPDHEGLTSWNRLLNTRGYRTDIRKKYTSSDIKRSRDSYKGCNEEVVLDYIGIRKLAKANYGAYNKGHFALGQKAYATFSSPIRRLSDYINQRIFKDSRKFGDKFARDKWEPKLELLAKMATDSELRADKVEMIMDDLKKAEYMSRYPKGTVFNAILYEVTDEFMRVILPNMVTGKIYYNPKYHKLGKDGFSLYNTKNFEQFLVGDNIEVCLEKVNIESGEITFTKNKNGEYRYEEEKKGKTKVKSR